MSKQEAVFDALAPARGQGLDRHARFRRAGDFVFVSGVGSPTGADIQTQTDACITELSSILEDVGGGLENLVEVTSYLARMTDFAGYNEAYGKRFSVDGPARTTVAVDQLTHPERLIEMRGVAYIAESASTAN